MRPSKELPVQEIAVGGPCGGESRGPGQAPHENLNLHKRLAPGARETTYWDDNGSERWLPWMGYLVPMRTSRFKKKVPHDTKFCPRQS
ncbi:hypothetical protein E2C01_071405 [Portunus trituberculatus]|uniref:Uncharacterized protein n=1 Tax=Portunus trituberculatus TaxID=210409 RepID=A0A5B7I7X3_PORTR|nr:hypothetical protein [Portunus trituberculatus]